METKSDMTITNIKESKTLSSIEVNKFVSEQIENILKKAGVQTDKEIVVKEVKGEDSTFVFRIDCGNLSYALKVFSNSIDGRDFYTNKIFNQTAIENGISTPKIIHSSDNFEILPAPWIIWEWYSGKQSCDIDSKSEREEVAVIAGIQLKKMHEIKMPGFGFPDAHNGWSGENVKFTIDFFIKRIRNLIKKEGTSFSEKEVLDILKVTAKSKELLSFTEPRLLHGDITGGNVLVSDSESITFIDPGEIIAGDPMSDLGYSQTTKLSPIFREGVWQGYTKDAPLTAEDYDRFLRWRLLRQCVIACRATLNKDKNAENYINDAHSFFEEFKKSNRSD